jgi:hypothetical protein
MSLLKWLKAKPGIQNLYESIRLKVETTNFTGEAAYENLPGSSDKQCEQFYLLNVIVLS